ncbi:MAG: hypothetical protein AAF479_02050, partial [Pseudomonadota bacterium]
MATIYTESFETDGNGTRYTTSTPEFTDGSGDFFTRTDGSNVGSFYQVTGQDGSFYFAGMDLDGEGAAPSQTLTISGIDITNFENLSLSLLVGEDDDGANQDWDADSQLLVEVSVDGGMFESLLDFQAAGGTNTEPGLDTTGDGLGDGTAVTSTFANFSSSITGTGSTLDVRISFNGLNAGDEDVAIDNIVIEGDMIVTRSFDYQEDLDGDLSGDNLAPTTISLPTSGTFTVQADQQGSAVTGGRDIDYLNFTVAAGSQIDSILLDNYVESSADGGAFYGIGVGPTLPGAPGGQSAGDLIGGLIFDESEIGQDILALGNGALGTGGFTSPLEAGVYTMWFNQTGGVNNEFDITFNVSELPTFDYDESVDGDLSGDNLAPTSVQLPGSGTFTIAAGQAGTPRDIDYVTINVPVGSQLDSFVIDDYIENQADGGAFFGIGVGTSLPGSPGGQSAGDLIGGILFDETEIGTDILGASNGGFGTGGFTAPLGAGDYTLWFNQLGGTVNTFEGTFNLS